MPLEGSLARRRTPLELSKRERQEHEPHVVLDFFFSAHGSAEDMKHAKELFKRADVIVFERPGWRPSLLAFTRAHSQSREPNGARAWSQVVHDLVAKVMGTTRFDNRAAWELEEDWLKGSQKPVLFVDIPGGSDEHNELIAIKQERDERNEGALEAFLAGDVERSVKERREYLSLSASVLKLRDDAIVTNMKRELDKLIETFPTLKHKAEIRVLITLGAAHTPVYHALRTDVETTRSMGARPFVFAPAVEAIRRIQFGKPLVDNDVLRGVLAHLLLTNLLPVGDGVLTNQEMVQVVRRLLSLYPGDDTQQLSQALGAEPDFETKLDLVRASFRDRGVALPTSAAELKSFAGSLHNSATTPGNTRRRRP